MILQLVGLGLLIGTGVLLYVQSVLTAADIGGCLILLITAPLFLYGVYRHVRKLFTPGTSERVIVSARQDLQIVFCSMGAIALTYALSVTVGLGAVVASGIVGLLASLFLPREMAVVAYTAAFAGMSSSTVLVDYWMVLCAGLLVGIVYVLTKPYYQGVGGRLGTIAAAAVLLTQLLFRLR